MAELDRLLNTLSLELYDHAPLREALVETLIAFVGDRVQHEPQDESRQSYPELLSRIEPQQRQAEKESKYRLSAALTNLSAQLRSELRESALAIYHARRAGQTPEEIHLLRTGLSNLDLPVGFPPAFDLVAATEQYAQTTRDLHTLQQHFPDQMPQIVTTLTREQHATARHLRDVAWDVLSTQKFTDPDLLDFGRTCQQAIQRRLPDAQNALIAICNQYYNNAPTEQINKNLSAWLEQFGNPFGRVFKDLLPRYKKTAFRLLISAPGFSGLHLLSALEPETVVQDTIETLMTARFGEEFCEALPDWQNWLHTRLNQLMHHEQAVTLWQAYPYTIPPLIVEWFAAPARQLSPSIELSEHLITKWQQELGAVDLSELLARYHKQMSDEERQILQQAMQPEPQTLPFEMEEIVLPPAQPDREEAPPPPVQENALSGVLAEGAVEAVLHTGIETDLLTSALRTTLSKSSIVLRDQLAVTIPENEAEMEHTPPEATVTLTPPTPPEPEHNLWDEVIFPFISENWAPLLGGSMVLTGLLLLEFYIWNRALWLRYGLSPIIFSAVAFVLAVMGRRLRQEEHAETPIAIIQGIVVFLAPMSLLFGALFFMDSKLAFPARMFWGLLLTGLLLAAWSYIFTLAISLVTRSAAGIHSVTLLLLNALLLLLPVVQVMLTPGDATLPLSAKAVLVAGFYAGFVLLSWSMRRVLTKMLAPGLPEEQGMDTTRIKPPLLFYSVTCLGTFALVWGLMHARLQLLPHPFTYGPLLILLSFLFLMVEFQLVKHGSSTATSDLTGFQNLSGLTQTGISLRRITTLSYAAYFLIGLGLLLSLSHEYVRVLALLLAGLVWLYQAVKLQPTLAPSQEGNSGLSGEQISLLGGGRGGSDVSASRHWNIAIVLLTLGFSMLALIHNFPAPAFPYLTLIIAAGIYGQSLLCPLPVSAAFAHSFAPTYLLFAFVIAIVWQWAGQVPPLDYGLAFVLFGLFTMFLGAKTEKLIHVHIGAFYCVAALPYLGTVDMVTYQFEGNTLVFGLAVVGVVWTVASTFLPIRALRDSRSTVLWNIGILAFCLLCLRLIVKDALDLSSNPLLQVQILSGPLIVGGLMLLAGYFTHSYVAVYLALIILVVIFPEIRARFDIPMYSGMGSTMSGIGLLCTVYLLRWWRQLQEPNTPDLIWRKKMFPWQASNNYLLFAHPMAAAAFFLFFRTIFITYPLNYFRPQLPFPINTPLAVILCGTAFHFFSVWYHKRWFSYIGFCAILCGMIHSCYTNATPWLTPMLLPVFLFSAFLYNEIICQIVSKILPADQRQLIVTPFAHLRIFAVWGMAFGFALLYGGYYVVRFHTHLFPYWMPLFLYLITISFWLAWRGKVAAEAWNWLLPCYLLFWQLVLLVATRGTPLFQALTDADSPAHVSTAGMVLGILTILIGLEWLLKDDHYERLSPLLWISFCFLIVYSVMLSAQFYAIAPNRLAPLLWPVGLWAVVSFLAGRALNLGLLWLWGLFLLHLLWFSSAENALQFYRALPPVILAGVAIILAVFTLIISRFVWLSTPKYPYPWAKYRLLAPAFLFALMAQVVVIAAFVQGMGNGQHRHAWLTIIGLFLATLPALFVARQFLIARQTLFSLPYVLAWIASFLAIRAHFPTNNWLAHLHTTQLISCGLFGAVLTLSLVDRRWPCQAQVYQAMKFLSALSIFVLLGFTYLTIRNLALLDWQWLVTSGLLAFGAGGYFRYSVVRE